MHLVFFSSMSLNSFILGLVIDDVTATQTMLYVNKQCAAVRLHKYGQRNAFRVKQTEL